MDTPERNQISTPTPISKFQESPFSNFINNLSPINPPKSIHVSQTLGSLTFSSPPSVFTSPHASLLKDKFLRRHQVFELEKSPFASDGGGKDLIARDITNADQQSDNLFQGEGSAKPLEDSSECLLQRVLTYDNGSPHCKSKAVICSDNDTRSEGDTSMALIPFVQDHPSARSSFGKELNPQDTNHDTEVAGCDWQSLIACNSDLSIFDSPDVSAISKQSSRKSQEEEENVLPSLLSRFPPDKACNMQQSVHVGSDICNEAQETIHHSTQPTEEIELQQIHQPSENQDISSVNEFLSSDAGDKPGKKASGNLHRGLLRRCLTFEMPRTKKNIEGVIFSRSLSSSQTEEKQLPCNRQPVTPRGDTSKCIVPGIGLHLNALAAASKDSGIPNQRVQSPTSQEPLINSTALPSLGKDEGPAENVLESAEDSSQASVYVSNGELNPNSPKKKRKKPETIGEDQSCKRCNCKKSKCLKLYCECFAAGIYCVELCSCQECFNKPIHEDIVLATRKQIESRNPLAFAPKVIRTTDSAQDLGEDSNRTPASARHKQGCNCKKSNCLKKYCECYQGGVGCSINCRCEGCKNAFGRKDGSILIATVHEMEKLQASEKTTMDRTSEISGFKDDAEQNSEFAISKTPSRLYRSSVAVATSSKGKPPRSSLGTINPSSGLLPTDATGRSTFLRTQSRIAQQYQKVSSDDIPLLLQNTSPPSSGLKTLSPNSRRISSPNHGSTQAIGLRSSRKLILQSIPSFPSLSPRR